jgi:RHS repeat-associated protein
MLLSRQSFGVRRLVSLLILLVYIFQPISAFAGVSLITGRFSYDTVDLAIGMSATAPIRLTRHYESLAGTPTDGPFGKGTHMGLWSLIAKDIGNGQYKLYMPTGEATYFTNTFSGSSTVYKNAELDDSLKGTLTYQGYYTEFVQEDGTRLRFAATLADGSRRLNNIRDKFGNGYDLTWCDDSTCSAGNGGKSLLTVTNTSSGGIEFGYTNGAFGYQVTQARAYLNQGYNPQGQIIKAYIPDAVVNYDYDGNGNLYHFYSTINQKSVQTISSNGTIGSRTAVGVTTYGYDGYNLTTVTNPRGIQSLVNTYANNKVTQQAMPGTSSTNSTDDLLTTYNYGSGVTSIAMLVSGVSKMQTNYSYDSNNYVTSVLNFADGSATSYTFDETNNLLTKATNSLGYYTTFSYANNDGFTNHIDKIFEYDSSVVTDYDYNALYGQLFKFTDANGKTTTNTYTNANNANGINLATPTGTFTELPSSAGYSYNQSIGSPDYVIDGMGRRSNYSYNKFTRALQYDSDPVANSATTLARNYEYDSLLRVSKVYLSSVPADQTIYTYDQLNRVTSVTNPGNRKTSYAYDDSGNITAIKAPNGVVTSYTYDAMNRVVSRTNSVYTESYLYNNLGQLSQKRDPKGQYTTYAYDAKGRLSTVTYAGASYLTYSYDLLDRVTSVTDSSGSDKNVSFTYFNENSNITGPKTVTTGAGAAADTLIYTYDKVGNLLKISRQTSNASFVSMSLQNGQPIPTQMVAGQTYPVQVKMQNTGNSTWTAAAAYRLGTQNPQDNTTWVSVNRVTLASTVNPGGTATFNFTITAPTTSGTYNFQWRMVQDGVQWFGAFSTNLVIGVSAPVSPLPIITSFNPTGGSAGDPFAITGGNFTGATSVEFINSSTGASAGASFTVGSSSQITATTPNVPTSTSYQIKICTSAGCNTSVSTYRVITPATPPVCRGRLCVVPFAIGVQPNSVSGGSSPDLLVYNYNADNSLKAASLVGQNGQADIQVGFAYNNAAELTNLNYGYTDVDIASNIKVYGSVLYNDQDDVAQLYYGTTQGGGNLRYVQYAYDYTYKGFLTNRAETGPPGTVPTAAQSQAFTYDEVGEWTSTNSPGGFYQTTYDLDGNATSVNGYESGTNRLTYAGARGFMTDANGNIKSSTVNGSPWEVYTWNARDQLVSYSHPDGTAASFVYDALGRRLSKTVNGVTTRFIYSGNQVIEEITNGMTKRYLVGLGLDDVWAFRQGSTDEFLLKDALNGSVMAVVDPASLSIKVAYAYTRFGDNYLQFGQRYQKPGTTSTNNLMFAGREQDLPSPYELYYFRGRYYATDIQRFLSEDPIGFAGGDTNLYRYNGNNPLIGNDPTGLQPQLNASLSQTSGSLSQTNGGNNGGFNIFDFFGNLFNIFSIFGGPQPPTGNPSMGPMSTGGPSTHGVRIDGNSEYFCGKYGIGCDAADRNQNVFKSENADSGTIDLFRGVGANEYKDISDNNIFRAGRYFEGKQFGLNLAETIKFADKYKNIVAIFRATIPRSLLKEFDLTAVDTFIFRSGTVTVEADKLQLLNQNLIRLKQVF